MQKRVWIYGVGALAALYCMGCGGGPASGGDSGTPSDSGSADAGPPDSGSSTDSGSADAGNPAGNDAGARDAGADAGRADAGVCLVADCSNPACTGFTCVAAVPAGWSGPVSLYDGTPAGDPSCTGTFPTPSYLGNSRLVAPPASCGACTCSPPQGQSCQLPTSILSHDAPCGQSPHCVGQLTTPPADGSCYGPDGLAGGMNTCGANGGPNCSAGTSPCNQAVTAPPAIVDGGSCSPGGGAATVTPPSWAGLGRACGGAATVTTGCQGGSLCTPRPANPFVSGLCIHQPGDLSCPPGPFAAKHLFYGGSTDNRSCSSCTCGGAANSTCAGTITIYQTLTANTCSGAATTLTTGTCVDLTGNPALTSRSAVISAQPSGGACPAIGGQPTGGATPTTPETFCCIP